jgi:hypothetical protein
MVPIDTGPTIADTKALYGKAAHQIRARRLTPRGFWMEDKTFTKA